MDTKTAFQNNYEYTPDEIAGDTLFGFNAALEAIKERFNTLAPRQTLIVNHGENHFSPIEKAHQIALMNALNADGINVVCGQELYHNGLFRHFTGDYYPQALRYTNPLDEGITSDNPVFKLSLIHI